MWRYRNSVRAFVCGTNEVGLWHQPIPHDNQHAKKRWTDRDIPIASYPMDKTGGAKMRQFCLPTDKCGDAICTICLRCNYHCECGKKKMAEIVTIKREAQK